LKTYNAEGSEHKINVGDGVVTDKQELSNLFNVHFSSVAATLASKIPNNNVDPLQYVSRVNNTFVFFESNAIEIEKSYCNLNLRNVP
jgi:hypothetical protein